MYVATHYLRSYLAKFSDETSSPVAVLILLSHCVCISQFILLNAFPFIFLKTFTYQVDFSIFWNLNIWIFYVTFRSDFWNLADFDD